MAEDDLAQSLNALTQLSYSIGAEFELGHWGGVRGRRHGFGGTMQGIGFTNDVSDAQLTSILEAVRERLTQQPKFDVTFHEPVIRPEAIALPPDPLAPFVEVRAAIRGAMADVMGQDTVPESDRFQPHVTLAYSKVEHEPTRVVRRSTGPRALPPWSPSIELRSLNSTVTTRCMSGTRSPRCS